MPIFVFVYLNNNIICVSYQMKVKMQFDEKKREIVDVIKSKFSVILYILINKLELLLYMYV